jgi:ABC-2 type transport system permease protein
MTGASGSGWRAGVQTSITQLQAQIDSLKAAPKSPQNQQTIGQMQMQLLQSRYSLAHNTNPNQGWTENAYQYINSFVNEAAQIFLPLLVVILVADMVSGEATDGTIKLLLVRPVSRVKILLGKWLVSLLGSILIAAAFFALMWLVAIAIAGPTGAGDPILVGVHYTFQTVLEPGAIQPSTFAIPHLNHAVVISQIRYFLIGGLFTLLALMAVATLALFCSTWFKSAMASTAVALGAVIIGFILTNIARHQTWVGWLFPTHLNLWQNWSGQLSLSTQQNLTLSFGLWVLALWTVVALFASLWRFARRDILNT